MLGLALVIAAVLLYKAYKFRLNHSERLRLLEEENARLRWEVEAWRARYESLVDSSSSSNITEAEKDTPQAYIRRVAEKIESRRFPLF
ncbi:MAG: hypothetical protein NZ933_09130 [Bacteroidia bacterium]|nr:hypothetical protein [Bacteroidia bacterium]